MDRRSRQAASEAGFAILLLGLCALVVAGARDIPPPIYDPLGSAALPLAAAALVGIPALVMLGRAIVTIRAGWRPAARSGEETDRPGLAAAFMAATVVYVAAMGAELVNFRDGTLLYLVASGLMLTRGKRALIVPVIATAAVIAVGGYYLFTRFFFIALP